MPYKLIGNCVHKEDEDQPIKCHDTPEEAQAHLAALNMAMAEESIRLYREAAITPQSDSENFTGKEWEVTIIGPDSPDSIVTIDEQKYLRSKNGRLYSLDKLAESTPNWDGVKVYDNHLTDEEFKAKQGMRSAASEWLGNIVSPYFDKASNSIKGVFKVVSTDLANKLLNAHNAGVLSKIGLSIDTLSHIGNSVMLEGKQIPVVEGFKKILSVDLVSEPAAGGKFNRVLAAEQNNNNNEGEGMNEEQIKELIAKAMAENKTAIVEELRAESDSAPDGEPTETEPEPTEPESEGDQEPEPELVETVSVKQFKTLECQMILDRRLAEVNLSQAGKGLVRLAFDSRIFEEKDLNKFIKQTQEAQAGGDGSGRVTESGQQRDRVTVGADSQEQAEQAFMRYVMGHSAFRNLDGNQEPFVQERIPESYRVWVKAGRPAIDNAYSSREWVYNLLGGNPLIDDRAAEAVTTSGMSSIVKNAVNLMIANDYSKRHRWWEPIVTTEEVDTIDNATLVRIHGLNNLDVVNEGDAYTELSWADQEETPTFVKRGNYVGVTIEAMLRDKVQAIRTLPMRLANSWYNSISQRVAAVFTVNTAAGPVLSDSGALFNATAASTTGGHANLLTAALSFTNYDASYDAMAKQTGQVEGAGRRLLIAPKYLLVPVDLRNTGLQIRNSEQLPGSANNDINPHYQGFEVVVVPEWTDTADWALVADPMMFPAIWLIFLTGNMVPSIFTADNDTGGAMFTNDMLRYKVRQMTWRFSATYDCAPVSDFRPLHKNNV